MKLKTDITTIHLVVRGILFLASASLLAGCVMSWHGDKEASVMILSVTTTTVGGLIGILVKATVDDAHRAAGTPTDPVNVAEAPPAPAEEAKP